MYHVVQVNTQNGSLYLNRNGNLTSDMTEAQVFRVPNVGHGQRLRCVEDYTYVAAEVFGEDDDRIFANVVYMVDEDGDIMFLYNDDTFGPSISRSKIFNNEPRLGPGQHSKSVPAVVSPTMIDNS